jgi:hypothetical protein
LDRLRSFAEEKGLEATFTMAAEAREYRETMALGKMSPEERERYHQRRIAEELAGENLALPSDTGGE